MRRLLLLPGLLLPLLAAACAEETRTAPPPMPRPVGEGGMPEGHPPIDGMPPGHPPTGAGSQAAPARQAAITWTAPAGWTPKPPSSSMRIAQYEIEPAAHGNPAVEVVIFGGITGGAEGNVQRWKGMFRPPEGAKPEEWSEVTTLEHDGLKITRADLTGTYAGGQMGGGPAGAAEDWTMLAAVVEAPAGEFHVRLVGPTATVREHEGAFDELLASLRPR